MADLALPRERGAEVDAPNAKEEIQRLSLNVAALKTQLIDMKRKVADLDKRLEELRGNAAAM